MRDVEKGFNLGCGVVSAFLFVGCLLPLLAMLFFIAISVFQTWMKGG